MQYRSKKEILTHHPLFESLSWWGTRSLAQRVELEDASAGEMIIRESEPAEAMYVVVSGRLEVLRELESGEQHREGILLNGDTFGESGLLGDRTNPISVRALNDSILLRVDRETLTDLMESHPSIGRELSERLARRVHPEDSETARHSELVVIGSGQSRVGKSHFGVNFCGALAQESGEPVCMVDLSRSPEGESVEKFPGSGPRGKEWLDEVARSHPSGFTMISLDPSSEFEQFNRVVSFLLSHFNYLVLIMPEGIDEALAPHYRQADTLFLLMEISETALYQARMMLGQLQQEGEALGNLEIITVRYDGNREALHNIEQRLEHSLLHTLPDIPFEASNQSLIGEPYVSRHPHREYSRTVRRLARRVGNVAVGLVLGVGAARGLSHIGVLKVLEQEQILVDVIAGSSIGSLIGAAWSIGHDADRMAEFARELEGTTGLMKLMDINWPTRGLFRGTGAGKFMKKILGDATFSDTEIPLRIVSTELNELNEVVFREGSLLQAVRASSALPFVYSPVEAGGKTYVDGGVLSPVPISALTREGVSRIIAVNPIPHLELLKEYQRDRAGVRSVGPFEWIKKQLTPFGRGNLVDTFMKSLQTMQAQLASTESSEADVLIEPPLPSLEWYEFNHPDRFIERGKQAAENQLDEINELVSPRAHDSS